jgi:ligand-binding sensor domain-containing protein
VTAISFDSKGTAWIGTFKQGLIRYDGNATFYNSNNSPLPDSIVIWDIAVDNNDNIWIGSDAGLIKYDKMDFTLYNTSNSPLAEDVVWSITIDNNNILWFASCRFRQGGLMKFDGVNWTLYTPENSELPSNSVRDVIVDSRNSIWVAMGEVVNNGCIIKITGDNWTIFDKEDIKFIPYYFRNLAVDIENNLYASIDYRLSSLWDVTRPNIIKYDDKNWTINNPVDEKSESLGYVGIINIDLLGNIWATLHGREGLSLAVFNGKKWVYNDSDIPIDWSSEIAVDKSNTVWLGTGDGIYLIKQ